MVFEALRTRFWTFNTSRRGSGRWRPFAEIVLLLVFVVVLELFGRPGASDLHDLLVYLFLIPLIAGLQYYHLKKGSFLIGGLESLLGRLKNQVKGIFQLEVGADFRSQKAEALTRNVPYRDLKRILVAALLFNAAVLPFHGYFPDLLQGIHTHLLYTPYLLVLLSLWVLLVSAIALDLVVINILFHHYVLKSPYANPKSYPQGRPWSDRLHPRRLATFASILVVLGVLEIVFGRTGWLWLMAVTAVITFVLAFCPRRNEKIGLLIKRPHTDHLLSISISEWNFSFYTVVQTLGLGLFVLTTGAGWLMEEGTGGLTSMPCTFFLGRLFGVFTSLATLFYLFAILDFLDFKRRRSDPALPREKVFWYRKGSLPHDLNVAGWHLMPAKRLPERDEADLYYCSDAAGLSQSPVPPFRKNLMAIAPCDRVFYLDRADFIAKRRIFYRGLKRLTKICKSSSFQDGAGFIMIPHCYFVEGLHRDDRIEHLEEDRVVGPDFQALWGLRVRHFLHRVFEAMDIDIIYFEETLGFDKLRAVFEILFELYHARGDRFRVEDYHFTGLLGVRVVVELIQPDQPRKKNEGYPETHFTNLSQARLLMVFKDRGGGLDLNHAPLPNLDVDIPACY